jgi:hypothetical protein
MAKQIQAGPVGITIAVDSGVVKLSADVSAALGGGAAAGVLKGKVAAELDLSVQQAGDLGLALLSESVPSMADAIAVVKAAFDAEVAKLSV